MPVDSASADEVEVNLDAETAFVDIPITVDTQTVYSITTQTGERFEVVNGQTVERLAWVDSWLELRQGDLVLRADDDSNHGTNNEYASKITGTIEAGTYIIRATSYNYIVAQQTPIGTYTVTSDLIIVQPAPSPSPSPTPTTSPESNGASPSPTESPTPSPSPSPTETTTPEPSPSPSTVPTPQPSPQPETSPTPEPTVSPSPAPSEPTPTPSPEPQPTSEATPSPTPSPESSVTPIPQPEPNPQPEPSMPEPTPLPSTNPSTEPTQTEESPILNPIPELEPILNPEELPSLDPDSEPIPLPSEEPQEEQSEIPFDDNQSNQTPEQPPLETSEIIDELLTDISEDGDITPADAEAVVDLLMLDGVVTEAEMTTLIETFSQGSALTGAEEDLILDALSADGEITQDEVNNLSETLSEDGQFTEAERELVAEVLIESAEGQAVTVEAIAEAGITLEDLPAEQPVEVRQDENGNEVVITAEVAVALELLTSAGDILSAVFESPAQLIFALGNLGADMSVEERKEASETIIAATIVGNIATTTMATAIGSIGYRRPN
jgi:hypothetical protein